MPIGQAVQQIGPIDPSSLIGRADRSLVEPKATAALIDSFRQGVITADDIVNRIGELGQAKKKAEVDVAGSQSMLAQEAMSPEAQAARAQGLATQTATGLTAQAQAERTRVLQEFPAVAYFDKFAPALGIVAPTLDDGTPDYKQMEKIGAELAVDAARKAEAQKELDNIVTKDTNDGSVLSAFTKQGEFVDPKRVAALRATATKPFSRQAPGTSTSATVFESPVVEARSASASTENLDTVRARLAETFGADVVVGMDEANLRQLDEGEKAKRAEMVAPRFSPTATGVVPTGTPVAGGVSLGNRPKVAEVPRSTAEQDKAATALARFAQTKDILDAQKVAGYKPTSFSSWIDGMMPEVLKSGDRKMFDTAIEAWGQGLLRLESGAAISIKEKDWYMKTFFPTVGDRADVVLAKEKLRGGIERAVAEIANKGGVISPEVVRNQAHILGVSDAVGPQTRTERGTARYGGAAAPGPSSAAPIIPLASGKRLQRDAQGNFQEVK